MKRLVLALMAFTVVALATPMLSLAAESQASPQLAQQRAAPLPKGSYSQSCSCQFSGGITLLCYCANLNGRMFQTNLDVRNCPQPNDIRNCNGQLKCTAKGQECDQ